MARHVIRLSKQKDETAFKVELIIGKTVRTDAINHYFFAGTLETVVIPGWGFNRYILRKLGPMAGTLMAVDPGPQVARFIGIAGETILRYNSRLPYRGLCARRCRSPLPPLARWATLALEPSLEVLNREGGLKPELQTFTDLAFCIKPAAHPFKHLSLKRPTLFQRRLESSMRHAEAKARPKRRLRWPPFVPYPHC